MENKSEKTNMRVRTSEVEFQTREAENGERYIEGYFAVFGSRYELWDGNAETVLPGAFAESLSKDDIRALVNHNTDLVLGRNRAGTLELHEDEKGLFGRIKVNRDDTDAMSLYARVQRGDVSQCSFGFDVLDETYEQDAQGKVLWMLKRVKLYEVSVVTFPAYEDTGVEARKHDLDTIKNRQAEAWRAGMIKKLKGDNADA